jgi:hypothetical protein
LAVAASPPAGTAYRMIARYSIGGNDTGDGHVVAVSASGSDPDGAVFNPRTQQIFTWWPAIRGTAQLKFQVAFRMRD